MAETLAEIAFRTAGVYLYTFALRWIMGQHGQVRPPAFYLFAVILIASSVGEPVFYMEIPLLFGMAGITLMVAVEETVRILKRRKEKSNGSLATNTMVVVREGCIDPQLIRNAGLSHKELFMKLRQKGIRQLGEVEGAYKDQDGQYHVSRYPVDQVRPGLPIVPPWDIEPPVTYSSGDVVLDNAIYACTTCGQTIHLSTSLVFLRCDRCSGNEWTHAALPSTSNVPVDGYTY